MFECKCGRAFVTPQEAFDHEDAGHPEATSVAATSMAAEPAPLIEPTFRNVPELWEGLTDEQVVNLARSLTLGDRVPFRSFIMELAKRLEVANKRGA